LFFLALVCRNTHIIVALIKLHRHVRRQTEGGQERKGRYEQGSGGKEEGTEREKERKYEWAVAKHFIWTNIIQDRFLKITNIKKTKGIYLFDHFWFLRLPVFRIFDCM
jgi:hypothetical protein